MNVDSRNPSARGSSGDGAGAGGISKRRYVALVAVGPHHDAAARLVDGRLRRVVADDAERHGRPGPVQALAPERQAGKAPGGGQHLAALLEQPRGAIPRCRRWQLARRAVRRVPRAQPLDEHVALKLGAHAIEQQEPSIRRDRRFHVDLARRRRGQHLACSSLRIDQKESTCVTRAVWHDHVTTVRGPGEQVANQVRTPLWKRAHVRDLALLSAEPGDGEHRRGVILIAAKEGQARPVRRPDRTRLVGGRRGQ